MNFSSQWPGQARHPPAPQNDCPSSHGSYTCGNSCEGSRRLAQSVCVQPPGTGPDWTGVLQVMLFEGARAAGASRGPELLCANLRGLDLPAPPGWARRGMYPPPPPPYPPTAAAALEGGNSQGGGGGVESRGRSYLLTGGRGGSWRRSSTGEGAVVAPTSSPRSHCRGTMLPTARPPTP